MVALLVSYQRTTPSLMSPPYVCAMIYQELMETVGALTEIWKVYCLVGAEPACQQVSQTRAIFSEQL
jgi:hypothetical protein